MTTQVRPGRWINDKRRVQWPVDALKVGMVVVELDRPWLETPFIFQGFTIRSQEDVDEIAHYCQWVIVEETEEVRLPAEERTASPSHKAPAIFSGPRQHRDQHRAQHLQEQTRSLTRSLMDDVRLGRAIDIKEVKNTVTACVRSVLDNPDAMHWVSRIRDKHEYTSEHSVNVSLLAITFGRHLEMGEEDLIELGMAGLLHDLGKMRTPNAILNKEGKLNELEWDIMRRHAQDGRDILMRHRNLYHGTVDVAHCHHEALDGTGYPRGLKANGISHMSRIVTVCDIYDAMTSDRAYKPGLSSLSALRYLYQGRGRKFDPNLVQKFINCIGIYPSGSLVELRSGEVGIVIGTNHRNRHLPRVLLLLSSDKCVQPQRVVHLEKLAAKGHGEQLIKTVLPNGAFGIRLETFIRQGLMLG